jgi:hypothetical protein
VIHFGCGICCCPLGGREFKQAKRETKDIRSPTTNEVKISSAKSRHDKGVRKRTQVVILDADENGF